LLGNSSGAWACAAIVFIAALLRFVQLGWLSFWYDEVVTMRLARAAGPSALIERLFQIDATRAPLHPLLLQAWITVFGSTEASARSLSVVCGIATVVLIHEIGRVAFDARAGLWAAWLAALSPILIVYAREARMYAWLVLLTCICWRLLLGLRQSRTRAKLLAYVLSLTALVYSHPLALLMVGTLAWAGLIDVRAAFGNFKRWLAIHLAVFVLILPWVGHYFDHPPEFLSGRLSPRFLLGTPIGFVGGNFRVLFGLVLLIALGVVRRCFVRGPEGGWRPLHASCVAYVFLFSWLVVPPVALYLYSWISYPVFGPARYTAFVAPAHLILVAAGLSRLPAWARYPVALALLIVSVQAIGPLVFAPELKADWRAFSAEIARTLKDRPGERALVIVGSADSNPGPAVDTARYYLPDRCAVISNEEVTAERAVQFPADHVFFAVSSRPNGAESSVPPQAGHYQFRDELRYPGLIVYRAAR